MTDWPSIFRLIENDAGDLEWFAAHPGREYRARLMTAPKTEPDEANIARLWKNAFEEAVKFATTGLPPGVKYAEFFRQLILGVAEAPKAKTREGSPCKL